MPPPQCSDTPDWWGHTNIHTAHHENGDDGEEEHEDNHDDGDESLHDYFCIHDDDENVDRDCGYLWQPWLICRIVNSHTTWHLKNEMTMVVMMTKNVIDDDSDKVDDDKSVG